MPEENLTTLLNSLSDGTEQAEGELLQAVYLELRSLARGYMRRQPDNHTLSPTALLHEAFIKIRPQLENRDWNHRGQFFSATAQAMRSVLVDYARKKQAAKRDAVTTPVRLSSLEDFLHGAEPTIIIALNAALERLDQEDSVLSKFVQLRFFSGLSVQDAAELVGWSRRTATRRWQFARAWLQNEIFAEE